MMKKLLLVTMTVLLNVLGASALDYTVREITSVKIEDCSTATHFKYALTIGQNAYNSSGTKYSSTAYVYLYPETHSLPGEYSVYDDTISYDSYIKYGSNANRYFESGTELTITDNKDGSYSISGYVASYSTSSYNYTYTVNKSAGYCIFEVPEIKKTAPTPDYSTEPSKNDFDFGELDAIYARKGDGFIELDLCSEYNTFALGFMTSGDVIPAGTYEISLSGGANSFIASSGLIDEAFPDLSVVQIMDAYFDTDNYFLTSGSVTISYENGGSDMRVTAEVYSSNGSTITVDSSAASPFKVPSSEEYTLTVSSISAVPAEDNSYFGLSIAAKNGDDTCNGYVKINSSTLAGEYDNETLGAWSYFGDTSNFIDGTDAENSVSIVATGNTDEYELNLRLTLQDGNVYIIEDAIFTYSAPAPPSPYESEPEASTFTKTFYSAPYVYDEGDTKGIVTLEFHNGELDTIVLPFCVSEPEDILPGFYGVSESGNPGTLMKSSGRTTVDGVLTDTPCLFTKSLGLSDYAPYYIVGGYVYVKYKNANFINISGELLTANGSLITIEIEGSCADINSKPLPENVMSGLLAGTDGETYMFAYDVTNDEDGAVTVSAIATTSAEIAGFQPEIMYDGAPHNMEYDAETGRCSYTVEDSLTKGDKVVFYINFNSDLGFTNSRKIEYTVE